MASAVITGRRYTNLFTNNTTSWLIGNVGDVINLELDFQAQIKYVGTYATAVTVANANELTRLSGSWFDDGFAEGQTVDVSGTIFTGLVSVPFTQSGTIATLTPTLMIITGVSITGLQNPIFPYQTTIDGNDYQHTGLTIIAVGTNTIQGIEFNYSLTTNTQVNSGNLTSLIDDTTITFKNANITSAIATPAVNLVPFGFKSGGAILSATIKGMNAAPNELQKFRINIKFIIAPFFDGLDNFIDSTIPNYFLDSECITDILGIKLLPQNGNPNVNITVKPSESSLQGNTGWFNENYNGGLPNYSIESVQLFNELGIPVSGITTSGKTLFNLTINDVNASVSSKYKMGFALAANDYVSNDRYYQNNLCYNGLSDNIALTTATTTQTFSGFTNSDGARMDIEFQSLSISGTLVTISGYFVPNAEFLNIESNYILFASVGNPSLVTNISDRVTLLAQFSELILPAIDYEEFNVTNSFLNHAQPSEQVGSSVYKGCVEDEVLARSIIKLDTSLDEFINEVTFTVEGFNFVTNERYTLESNTYDCSGFVKDANGIQQINIDTTRGFLMASGVEKNEVKIYRNESEDVGDIKSYRSNYAFRLRWEDWIASLVVPNVFFDNTKLNNNLNNTWAFKDISNWKLTFNIYLNVNRGVEVIQSRNTYDFTVKNYDVSDVYDGAITTFDSAKVNSLFLGYDANGIRTNAILGNDNTWIEADFDLEDLMGDVGSIADYFGVIRLEEYRNGGLFKIEMLSSILTNTNNILMPLVGETKAKLTKISDTKIRLEGLINKNKLNLTTSQYKISARLGCSDINLGAYNSKYTLKYN